MQIIGQEACYDSETDQIFIPFKDSNLLYNDLFQTCVIKLFYTNISGTLHYNNQIDKDENFWGLRMDLGSWPQEYPGSREPDYN